MPIVNYYRRPGGELPARDWLNELEKEDRKLANLIRAKLLKLSEEGLRLLNTNMLKPIEGESNLYEIIAGQARVCVYHEIDRNVFLVLYGFRKKKQRETREIEYCRSLMAELIDAKQRNPKGGYDG
jgi:hypothetical protein